MSRATNPPGTSAEAAAFIERLERAATRHATACGDGAMWWHAWGDGVPVVLLHGGFGSWLHWARNVAPLARDFRVLALDIPGLGESDDPPPPATPESIGALVTDGLARLVEPGARLHLVGFSFGALIAGQVAAALGGRVASLTLVGASGLGLERPPLELVRRHDAMSESERIEAQRHNLRALMLNRDSSVDALALHIHATNDARARLRSRRHSMGDSLRRVLPRVGARLHGIWGEHDATVGQFLPERRALLERLHPETQFRVIAGAGHWVQYEASEEFNETLAALCAE